MEAASGPSKPPLPKDDGEKRILDALEQARGGERYANVSTADGRLLRQLTEARGCQAGRRAGHLDRRVGLWFSLALRKTGGKLYTHDIDPGRIAVARENFKKAGVDDLIVITEGDAHQTAPQNKDPIDILFIDAEKEGYAAYLKELLPLRPPRRPDHRPQHADARPRTRATSRPSPPTRTSTRRSCSWTAPGSASRSRSAEAWEMEGSR